MSENILEINNLSKYFGGLAAVFDCSLKVKKDEKVIESYLGRGSKLKDKN